MSTRKVFFEWQDAYSVNIRTLDEQHKALVGMLNCLFTAAFERKANKVVVEILGALRASFETHFALEEKLLLQMKHKDLAAQQVENRKLLGQLDQLRAKHLKEDLPVYFDMLCFLKQWLADHFHGVDSDDLVKVGLSTAAWERSANEEFPKVSESKNWCGERKAA